jgi:hypothetical protein
MKQKYAKSFEDIMYLIRGEKGFFDHKKHNYCYRGQAFAGWRLIPSIFRDTKITSEQKKLVFDLEKCNC